MMSTFIPPYPPRHLKGLSTLEILRKGRDNLLSIWTEDDFQHTVIKAKLLKQHIVIANSPDTVRKAFVTANGSFEEKSHLMQRALRPLIGDGLFISHGETWRTRRRIVGSVIHGSRVPGFTPSMIEAMVELRDQWMQRFDDSSCSMGRIDMLSDMAKLTADVISRAIFGRQLGRDHAHNIAEGFAEYQKNIGPFNLLPLLGVPASLTYLFTRGIRRSARKITRVLDDLVDGHFKQHPDHETSVLGILSRDTPDGKTLDRQAIRNEAAVIFMAGHETTANCLAWAWFLLSQAPQCEEQLHREIDQVLDGRVPTFSDVHKLIYTRAIIEETLRLYPPIPILSRQANRQEQLGEHVVPVGGIVAVIPWLLHRHRLYWESPDHFMPERFLPNHKPPDKYAYIPFSTGPRVCAGMSFGLTEAILALAVFGQKLRFQLVPNTSIQAISHLSLRPDDGHGQLPMKISPREIRYGRDDSFMQHKVCEHAPD
ncbi:MAG: cytochrome P450 [Legionellales bacterium]|nr:cytochrome P450 [Legionellales bacterium]